MQWEPVIGIEVHTRLNTQTKLFSGAASRYGEAANTLTCPIDMGLPGVLPVLNEQAIKLAIAFGLGIEADIPEYSVFARKNYFYPDMPKGYQISQFEHPIVVGGHLDIIVGEQHKRVNITRAHLEEDAGKSTHEGMRGTSGIDLNRSGTPLLEIVSEPELYSAEEAIAYLRNLHQLVRYLDISDGNMQEGSFKCDINISLRPAGSQTLGTRAEIKNVNSFRFIQRAIEYEISRQQDLLEKGQAIVQETRQYDHERDVTRSMRVKEDANDYRYFPDPDLLPVHCPRTLVETIRTQQPELPQAKYQRYLDELKLNAAQAQQLTQQKEMAHYFEATLAHCQQAQAQQIAPWITSDIQSLLHKHNSNIEQCPLEAPRLAELIDCVIEGIISNTVGKQLLDTLWQQPHTTAAQLIQQQGLEQISDTDQLQVLIDDLITQFPQQTSDYRAGKVKLFSFFVGQVMKATQGKANPQQVSKLLKQTLDKPSE